MSIYTKLKDKNRLIARMGFGSSLLTGILNIWYLIGFITYQPILHAPWPGLKTFAENFHQLPLLLWVIPCFSDTDICNNGSVNLYDRSRRK